MTTARQIYQLLRWELRAEWRDRSALGGVLLYVVGTVVILYLALRDGITPGVFNALFWVVVFFGATVAAARSFLREGGKRHYYYYTLASPEALLLSKFCFNLLTIWLVGGLSWLLLGFFTGGAEVDVVLLLVPLLLAGPGLAGVLSFTAALGARAGRQGILISVLSFPLLTPLLYLLVTAGSFAIGEGVGSPARAWLLTLAVDLLVVAVGIVLFPFVWRD